MGSTNKINPIKENVNPVLQKCFQFGEFAEIEIIMLYNLLKVVVIMNRIRELRLAHDMKQADLAKLLSCASTAVSKYELDQLDLSSSLIHKLCDIFNVSADYLLCRTNVPTWEISPEEESMLTAYRRSDDRARDMVNLALSPFAQDGSTSATA